MKPVTFLAALLALAACDSQVETRKAVVPPAEQAGTASAPVAGSAAAPAPAPQAARLTASGPAATVRPETAPDLQDAASVVALDQLKAQGYLTTKLFGTAGGDPAMNGLYTYIAFYEGAETGWTVFRIGDFLGYRILSEAPGRVDLEVDESVQLGEPGDIGSRKRRLIVGWAAPEQEGTPDSITVTPAG